MPLMRCLNKDLVVVVLSSLHTNRNKLKGSEDFNDYWPRIIVICVIWCRHA